MEKNALQGVWKICSVSGMTWISVSRITLYICACMYICVSQYEIRLVACSICYPTLSPGKIMLPAPAQRMLAPLMKNTDTHIAQFNLPYCLNCQALKIYHAQHALSNTFSSAHLNLTSASFAQLALVPAQHLNIPPGEVAYDHTT